MSSLNFSVLSFRILHVFFAFRMAEFVGLVFQYNQTDWNWVNLIIMMGKTFLACVFVFMVLRVKPRA